MIAQPLQEVAQRAHGEDVEPARGLVEHDVARLMDERARERNLHALAVTHPRRAAVAKLVETDRRERAVHCGREGAAAQAVQASREPHVLDDGQARIEAEIFVQHAEPR